MRIREFLDVDPATLHVPGSRRSGADPYKLQRQIARHGMSIAGMPAIEVSRGTDGELVINNGVTRATRAAAICRAPWSRWRSSTRCRSPEPGFQPLENCYDQRNDSWRIAECTEGAGPAVSGLAAGSNARQSGDGSRSSRVRCGVGLGGRRGTHRSSAADRTECGATGRKAGRIVAADGRLIVPIVM